MAMEQILIAKVGGGIISDESTFEEFLRDFAAIESRKVLVHGGGRIASEVARSLEIPVALVEGRRITDEDMLRVVIMTYGGLVNKRAVATLQRFGCNAIGVSGADADLIRAKRRPAGEIDYGYVGDITTVNSEYLESMLRMNLVPVIASLTHDGKGQLLNTNADTIAAALSESLASQYRVQLFFCFEEEGVLLTENDEISVIEQLSAAGFRKLQEKGAIHSGMVPKLDNGFRALKAGVEGVTICHPSRLSAAFNTANGDAIGTRLIADESWNQSE